MNSTLKGPLARIPKLHQSKLENKIIIIIILVVKINFQAKYNKIINNNTIQYRY